ncbi:hypothetical protein QO179_23560 [Bacillus stercoris]|nr:hypothetical protein [Bacillus stercoris]
MEEGPELLIPKIPMKYLLMVLSFYREIHKKDGTEASVLFFWNHDSLPLPTKYQDQSEVKGLIEDGQLVIYCPIQENSSTLSEFGDDGMVSYLRDNCTPLCETHSHHTMDAFWSGTDNANENMTQFYGVWGKINDAQPKFLFRWVSGESKVNIDPSILFDYPIVETKTVITKTVPGFEPEVTEKVEYESFKGPWENIDVPEDWIGQHKKKYAYSYKPGSQKPGTYNYGGAGYKYQGYGNHADAYDYYKEDSFYDKKTNNPHLKKTKQAKK